MDANFLKPYAERCRSLEKSADEFTKRRLLDLAVTTTSGLGLLDPSAATRIFTAPLNLIETPMKIPASLPRFWKIGRRSATVPQQQSVKPSKPAIISG
jgi:hypothetical protein